MPTVAYTNGGVLTNGALQKDLAVIVNDTCIKRIIPRDQLLENDNDIVDLEGNNLLPGYIDTQVNGGGGVLFNNSPDLDGIKSIATAHSQFGTTGLLPTLISDDLEVVWKGLDAVNTAIEEDVPGILGIHIEGPFLNPERRGIHDASKMKKLTCEIVNELQPLDIGCTMLTIAPEMVEPALIRKLVEKGFIVCAGHTNASHEEVSIAVDNGLTGFTHLFNAMSQLGAREPGVVGAGLDHDDTWCGIIADGHHVSPASLRIAFSCKGAEKLMLVTDAMPLVGGQNDEFDLHGKHIFINNGVCMDACGTLAGAALDMATAVHNMMKVTGCSLVEVSLMASGSPAAFLGLEGRMGSIRTGMRADFVVVDAELGVQQTIIGGRRVF